MKNTQCKGDLLFLTMMSSVVRLKTATKYSVGIGVYCKHPEFCDDPFFAAFEPDGLSKHFTATGDGCYSSSATAGT
jgi:hypothetical protein